MKRWTRVLLTLFGILVFVVPLTAGRLAADGKTSGGGPARVAASGAEDPYSTIMSSAKTLGPYVQRMPDGTLRLEAPTSVLSGIPSEDLVRLRIAVATTNTEIRSGMLATAPSGVILEPGVDRLNLQGGWSGYGRDWTHMWWCLSHSDILKMENWGWWTMSGAALAALTYFAGAIGLAASVVVGVYGGWMALADKGNGSCLNIGFWPPPNAWVTSQ